MCSTPIIGIDLGYGWTKLAGSGFRKSFPAVVAEPSAWSEIVGRIEWKGNRLLVGTQALTESHHRYATRLDKITTTDEMAKYLVSLALACDNFKPIPSPCAPAFLQRSIRTLHCGSS